MGVTGFFLKPRKYDYRCGYLKDRQESMMKRVEKICKDNNIEMNLKSSSEPISRHSGSYFENRNEFKINAKVRNIIILLIIIVLLCLLIYL